MSDIVIFSSDDLPDEDYSKLSFFGKETNRFLLPAVAPCGCVWQQHASWMQWEANFFAFLSKECLAFFPGSISCQKDIRGQASDVDKAAKSLQE